ncbi:MAG: class I SAM-dependent methyltransferase [Firmicutes bacterium]|nr:class I SAM-dependent methyltransferase [Bacillota bacterium]
MKNVIFSDTTTENIELRRDEKGLTLVSGGQELRGDFMAKLHRVKGTNYNHEILAKVAKIKDADGPLTAIDATAGLGEDSFILAAAGFNVTMYEKNPVIYELLADTIDRALSEPELSEIVSRMNAVNGDSIEAMHRLGDALDKGDPEAKSPDIVLLDPMFPERQKSALVKKKLQVIQSLEEPCNDEKALMLAAIRTRPKKLIIKRPPKGPYLAGIKPDFSNGGKAVRFDCIVNPYDRIHKFNLE